MLGQKRREVGQGDLKIINFEAIFAQKSMKLVKNIN